MYVNMYINTYMNLYVHTYKHMYVYKVRRHSGFAFEFAYIWRKNLHVMLFLNK